MSAETNTPRGPRQPSPKDAAGPLTVIVADRVAHTLTLAFEIAAMHERPLSELQQRDLIAAALQAFDGTQDEMAGSIGVDRLLRENAASILAGLDGAASTNGEQPAEPAPAPAVDPIGTTGGVGRVLLLLGSDGPFPPGFVRTVRWAHG